MIRCNNKQALFTSIALIVLFTTDCMAQSADQPLTDTTKKVKSIAAKAASRSAMLPGLGQIYNKKYWKIPLVYGVLAIPVYTFDYNSKWYTKTRYAYSVRMTRDTANYKNIAPELKPLSNDALKSYRNGFRKNMDFSVLGFILAWGLNVVDAAVDGHLRTFNISDDLSFSIDPKLNNFNHGLGLSATFHF